jgi:selenocysteine lyase/cysteine desulfurase
MLEHQIIASITPYQPTYIRFSPGLVNTPAEIETVIEAVRGVRWSWV